MTQRERESVKIAHRAAARIWTVAILRHNSQSGWSPNRIFRLLAAAEKVDSQIQVFIIVNRILGFVL